MATITIEIDTSRVQALFAGLGAKLTNLSPALTQIGELVVKSVQDNFEQGRSPDGVPWKPSRRAIKQGGKTLLDTGLLRDSLSKRVERDQVVVGVGREYAAIHQFGGSINIKGHTRKLRFRISRTGQSRFAKKSKANFEQDTTVRARTITMPARPYLGVRPADWPKIEDILRRHCLEAQQ